MPNKRIVRASHFLAGRITLPLPFEFVAPSKHVGGRAKKKKTRKKMDKQRASR